MIHAMIHICPECRNTVVFIPHDNGTFASLNLLCSDDGYLMKPIRVDDSMIDQLLKHGAPNADEGSTRP